MVYDTAKSHTEREEFLDNLSIEHAHTHIGMYLGWIIQRNLYSEDFGFEAALQIRHFKEHAMSCGVLSELWGGELSDEMLSDEANEFTKAYYASGMFLEEYRKLFPRHDCIYLIEDNWDNYNRVANLLNVRYAEWKENKSFG